MKKDRIAATSLVAFIFLGTISCNDVPLPPMQDGGTINPKYDQTVDHVVEKDLPTVDLQANDIVFDSNIDLPPIDFQSIDTTADLNIDLPPADLQVVDLAPDGPVLCDDQDPCTKNDVMTSSGCKGTPYTCNDNDTCTLDTCLGDGTCSFTANYPCTIGYTISPYHYSASVSYSKNRIRLMEITLTAADQRSLVLIEDMGSFTDSTQWWNVWYDNNTPPVQCYDKYATYAGTIYEGMDQSHFIGTSKADLVSKIRATLSDSYSYRWPSNSAGGDLCQSGNWWTVLKFTADGATHIESLLAAYNP